MSALDIAKYIINFALDKNCPISNLQLQKILYFLHGNYYKEEGVYLIEEAFYAYPLGPVNKLVYFVYSGYGASKIFDYSKVNLDENINQKVVNKILEKFIFLSARNLVELSHNKNGAWYLTKEKVGLYKEISREFIINEFER